MTKAATDAQMAIGIIHRLRILTYPAWHRNSGKVRNQPQIAGCACKHRGGEVEYKPAGSRFVLMDIGILLLFCDPDAVPAPCSGYGL